MATKLERISQLSRENPDVVFTSIGHLIDKELLRQCHKDMDGKKAVGIDGVTKEEYGANLENNLDSLVICLLSAKFTLDKRSLHKSVGRI